MEKRKLFLWTLYAFTFCVSLFFWWKGSSSLFATGPAGAYIALGRISGLLLSLLLFVQIILIGRVPFIEQAFGHDGLNAIHRKTGYFLSLFIFLHPIFLVVGWGMVTANGFFAQTLDFLFHWDGVAKAIFGFSLIIIAAFLSLPWIKRFFMYDKWHIAHLLMYVGVILAFSHQAKSGDIAGNSLFLAYWYFVAFAAGLLVAWYRFLRPIKNYAKYRFVIEAVVPESPDTYSFIIGGKNIEKFPFLPGQFANILIPTRSLWWRPHPFSFSDTPGKPHLRFTIKKTGPFTNEAAGVAPGMPVVIDGPLGIFTRASMKGTKVLFVAGGIGITPIRALAEDMAKDARIDAQLLYSARTRADLVFEKELSALRLKTTMCLSKETAVPSPYIAGVFDRKMIEALVPDIRQRDIFMCGPTPMMSALEKTFLELGVFPEKIHYEKFSY